MTIRFVFSRPTRDLKVYDDAGQLRFAVEASGAAICPGHSSRCGVAPYGHYFEIPPGHYRLSNAVLFAQPDAARGPGQIGVDDLTASDVSELVAGGVAAPSSQTTTANGTMLSHATIGGIDLPYGGLAAWKRSEILLHGGGSALGAHANDAMQELCRTLGCTRLHNADVVNIVSWLLPLAATHFIVLAVNGDSPPVTR